MSMLVGYTAGAVVVLPFDRIKSLMQVSDASRQQGATGVARTIIASQGIRGLYKGLSAAAAVDAFNSLHRTREVQGVGGGSEFPHSLAQLEQVERLWLGLTSIGIFKLAEVYLN